MPRPRRSQTNVSNARLSSSTNIFGDNRIYAPCEVVITSDLRRIADNHLRNKESSWNPSWDDEEEPLCSNLGKAPAVVTGRSSNKGSIKWTTNWASSSTGKTDATTSKLGVQRGSKGSSTASPSSSPQKPKTSIGSYAKSVIFKNWKAQKLERCEKCEGEFEDLKSHLEECPKNDTLWNGASFKTFDVISKPEDLKCPECGKTFQKKIHLTLHQKIHATMDKRSLRSKSNGTTTHSKMFTCNFCPVRFGTSEELVRHYSSSHAYDEPQVTKVPEYNCLNCQRQFSTEFQLVAHKRICREEENMIITPQLDFHDTLFQYLANSQNEFSESELKIESTRGNTAGGNFFTFSSFDETDSNSAPISMDVSEPDEEEDSSYSSAKPKPKFECPECSQKFFYKSYLDFHMKSHIPSSPPTPPVPVTCKVCNNSFDSPALLQEHSLLHKFCEEKEIVELNKLPFKCENSECDQNSCRFSEPADLTEHIVRTHWGESGLCCEVCGKNFDGKVKLGSHRFSAHSLSQPTFHYLMEGKTEEEQFVPNPYILFKKEDNESVRMWKAEVQKRKKPGRRIVRTDIPLQDVYECISCDKKFTDRRQYLIHLREEQYKCQLCQKGFHSETLLLQHIPRHDDPNYVPSEAGGYRRRPGPRGREDIPHQSSYKCETCGKKIWKRKLYLIHINQHKREEKYTCEQCGRKFLSDSQYQDHLERHKDPEYDPTKRGRFREDIPYQDEYTCEKCNKIFDQRQPFMLHLNQHAREEKYTCEQCGRKFLSEGSYEDHLEKHKDPEYDPYRYRGYCVREDIPHQTSYTCETCGKKISKRKLYLIHLNQHKREEKYTCEHCGRKFLSDSQYQDHLERHKDPEYDPSKRGRFRDDIPLQDEYTCEKCSKVFTERHPFMLHLNQHVREEKYTCNVDQCGRKFLSERLLNEHLERHNDPNYDPSRRGRGRRFRDDIPIQDEYTCEQCSKVFKERHPFLIHLSHHIREERYTCAVENCGRKFLSEKLLKEHKRRHKDPDYDPWSTNWPRRRGRRFRDDIPLQDEYTCEQCSRVFKERQSYIMHLSQHSREEKYTCNVDQCGRKFLSERLLNEHLEKHNDPNYDPSRRGRGRRFRDDIPIQDEYTCGQCGKIFKERQLYVGHLSLHAREEKYRCTLCEKKCLNKFLLEEHLKRHEDPCYVFTPRIRMSGKWNQHLQGATHFTCEFCGKKYPRDKKGVYYAHVHYHKTMASGKYKCPVCFKVSSSQKALDEHLRRHANPKYKERFSKHDGIYHIPDQEEYECQECKMKFTEKYTYQLHLLREHNYNGRRGMDIPVQGTYECKHCNKTFTQRQKYLLHVRYHELQLNYECPHCQKRFKMECNLATHIQSHNNEKIFECEDCLKMFQTKIVKDIHKQKYCKKVPCKYKCGRCSDRFHNKVTLTRHFERWHAPQIEEELKQPEIELSCRQCSQTFNTELGLNRHVMLYHPTTEVTFQESDMSAVPEVGGASAGVGVGVGVNGIVAEEEDVGEAQADWDDGYGFDDMPLLSTFCEAEMSEKPVEDDKGTLEGEDEDAEQDRTVDDGKVTAVPRPIRGACICGLKTLKYKTQKVCVNTKCPCVMRGARCGEKCRCEKRCLNTDSKEQEQQESFREGRQSMILEQLKKRNSSEEEQYSPPQENDDDEEPFMPIPPVGEKENALKISSFEFISIDTQPADESLRQLSFAGYVEGDDDPLGDPLNEPTLPPPPAQVAPQPPVTPTSSTIVTSATTSSSSTALKSTITCTPSSTQENSSIQVGSASVNTSTTCFRKTLEDFTQSASLMCQFCRRTFKTMPTYISHLFVHRKFDCTFSCPICTKQFTPIIDFVQHLDTHNKGISLQCTKCNSIFKAYADLSKHMKILHYRPMECGMCNLKFPNSPEMMTHWTKVHPTCQCGLCMVKFFSYDDLTFHMKSLHSAYNCNLCGDHKEKLEDLLMHIKLKHMGQGQGDGIETDQGSSSKKTLKCSQCNFWSATEEDLNAHLVKHLLPQGNVRRTQAPVVQQQQQQHQTNNYRINDNTEAEEVFTCPSPKCGKTLRSRKAWITHVRSHGDIVLCSACYNVFSSISEIKEHIRVAKCVVYQCNRCLSNFSQEKYLIQHARVHSISTTHSSPFNTYPSAATITPIPSSQVSSTPVIVASTSLAKGSEKDSDVEEVDVDDANVVTLRHHIEEITLD